MAVGVGRRRAGALLRMLLRTLLLLFLVSFVWLQLHLAGLRPGGWRGASDAGVNDSAAILSMVPQVLHKYLIPKNQSVAATAAPANDSVELDAIPARIRRYNAEQRVLNEDLFGPLQADALVIVIQVHTRLIYLRHLIVSLAQAKDIDQVLLVFSHDYYDEEINELVQAVDFCKVMQIFYPFSIQTHPDTFPGESPEDCPRDIKKEM